MKRTFLFLIFGGIWGNLFSQLHYNPIFQYLPAEKFGVKTILGQTWDNKGQVWVSSEKGLLCYNGYSTRLWKAKPGDKNTLLSNNIQSMFMDSRNRLWISYVDTIGLTRFDTQTKKVKHFLHDSSLANSLPHALVVRIVEDSKKRLWGLMWEGGMFRLDPEKGPVKIYTPNENRPQDNQLVPYQNVKAMTELKNGTFLMGFFGEGKAKARPHYFDAEKGTFTPFPVDEYAKGIDPKEFEKILISLSLVHFIHVDKDENVWFGTYCGIVFFDKKNKTCKRISGMQFDAKVLNLDNTRSFVVDENSGYMWTATPNKGVLVVDMKTKKTTYLRHSTTSAGSIADNRISSCRKDPDGNIWVATGDGGISICCPIQQQLGILPWDEMQLEYTLQSEQTVPVNQLLVRNKNQVFVSHGNGMVIYDPEERKVVERIEIKENTPAKKAKKAKDKQKNKDEREMRRIENFKFIDDNHIFVIHSNKPKVYNVQTKTLSPVTINDTAERIFWQRSILFKHNSKINKIYTFRQWPSRIFEFNPNTAELSLFADLGIPKGEDYNSTLKITGAYSIVLPSGKWLLSANQGQTPNGVNNRFFIFDPVAKKTVTYGHKNSEKYFPDSLITNVHLDSDNNVWILTDNGIYKFDETTGKSENWNKKLGLGDLGVKAMTTDKNGIRWLILEKKVARWNPETNKVYVFDKEMGMPEGSALPAVAQIDNEGKIYSATMNGILWFDPSRLIMPVTKPILNISTIVVHNDTLSQNQLTEFMDGKAAFDWNENFLNIYLYSSQVFAPSPHRFYYRLQGFDTEWQDNGISNHIRYPDLANGSYTLEVVMKNAYGIESEILRVPFVIKRPFWKTWWFYLIVAGMLVFAIRVYVRFRERAHLKQQQVLERMVEERTAEVVEKAKEISHQKDIIQEKNKELTDSIHYAERIQRSILPDEKTLKKNLPNHFVLFKPKDIVSGDFYWHAKQKDSMLWAVVDCTGHGVPGGFMSMLGAGLLNQIVNEEMKLQPDLILNELRDRVIIALKQTGAMGENRDGMDITLCRYIPAEKKIQFAGANNSLYILRKGELTEYAPDKQPIGIYVGGKKDFLLQEITVEPDDLIYMTSDGYYDQFGGEKGKKFKTSNFEKLLKMVCVESIDKQMERIEETFTAWKGDFEQLDDVCVMGVKI
ncbi:MAG TPA: SpoIIE family protein phosphatase [Flavobacteriales bacterium]|nr:SpoIIE family protein phosphatase [Flavobacteriales bacterium]